MSFFQKFLGILPWEFVVSDSCSENFGIFVFLLVLIGIGFFFWEISIRMSF
jgi:hypothetical protein